MATVAPPRLLRAKEVAQILGVDPSRVRELVAAGSLPSVRLGAQGWHRFRPDDVERLIAGKKVHERGKPPGKAAPQQQLDRRQS